MSKVKVRALVYEDIPANRLIGLAGVGTVEDRDPSKIYLIPAREQNLPDFITKNELKAGEEVIISIDQDKVWEVEASEHIWAGTLVTTADDGKIQNFKRGLDYYIGFSLHEAQEGETVKFAHKHGIRLEAIIGTE